MLGEKRPKILVKIQIYEIWYTLESPWALLKLSAKKCNFAKIQICIAKSIYLKKCAKKVRQIWPNIHFWKALDQANTIWNMLKIFVKISKPNVYSRKTNFPLKSSMQNSMQKFSAKIVLSVFLEAFNIRLSRNKVRSFVCLRIHKIFIIFS